MRVSNRATGYGADRAGNSDDWAKRADCLPVNRGQAAGLLATAEGGEGEEGGARQTNRRRLGDYCGDSAER